MVAIQTKYIGPSNVKGSRVKAFTCNGVSKTISYDQGLDSRDAHFKAAMALADKCGWTRETWFKKFMLCEGGVKDGYVWVLVEKP